MRIKIQIKGIKDLDLLTLYYHRNFNLAEEIKSALKYYVRKTGEKIPVPDTNNLKEILLDAVNIYIVFDDIEEADIIKFLSHIKQGHKTFVIKTIFRNEIQEPVILNSIDSKQTVQKKEKISSLQYKKAVYPKTTKKKENMPETNITENADNEEWDMFSGDFITNY